MPRYKHNPSADLTFSQSSEGIDRAELLAASTFDHFVSSVGFANLDTVIASTFLVTELLAALQVFNAVEPEALISQFRYLVDQRATDMRRDCAATLGDNVAPPNNPATLH